MCTVHVCSNYRIIQITQFVHISINIPLASGYVRVRVSVHMGVCTMSVRVCAFVCAVTVNEITCMIEIYSERIHNNNFALLSVWLNDVLLSIRNLLIMLCERFRSFHFSVTYTHNRHEWHKIIRSYDVSDNFSNYVKYAMPSVPRVIMTPVQISA